MEGQTKMVRIVGVGFMGVEYDFSHLGFLVIDAGD